MNSKQENKQNKDNEVVVNSKAWLTTDIKQLDEQLSVLRNRREALMQLGKVDWLRSLDFGIAHLELVIQQRTKTVGTVRQNINIL